MLNPQYKEFLENKIVVAESFGQKIDPEFLSDVLLPHQKVIVPWCLEGGRRAIFASFGLGKSIMQLEIAKQVMRLTGKPFLICMPLGVVGEFRRDNELLATGHEIEYITDTDDIDTQIAEQNLESTIRSGANPNDIEGLTLNYRRELGKQEDRKFSFKLKIYVTNYERVRKGDIDPNKFGGVSFDEASILRNLQTETTNYVLKFFRDVKYRFVATATPTPNDFIEILNYADYLGVIDRGHALTRFFQRDSTKAGHLTLYPNKKAEFWKWVSTWAIFINKPSDLGFDDTGYNLPALHFNEVEVLNIDDKIIRNKKGDIVLFKDTTKSLVDVSREKSDSIQVRVDKAFEIIKANPGKKFILWHHREAERFALEKKFADYNYISVYGSQKNSEKEKHLIDFSEGKYDLLISKPVIAGSGCNFQHVCHNMIFVGIDYKFNDFIQAIHRIFRFRQQFECNVWAIYTNNEYEVLKTLKEKWRNHIELQTEMINIVREYGLNSDKIIADMKRQIFNGRRMARVGNATVYNEDTVVIHEEMEDNSIGMILTSIPFGDHYEYSDNYNDFGHNHGNENFFKQMDFLIPNLLRTLKPGRIAAIHVKDRIRYSYQNGTSFTTISDFSGQTVSRFTKEHLKDKINMLQDILVGLKKNNPTAGESLIKELETEIETLQEDYKDRFYLVGKITITTDVVRENNQTYRLTWGEQRKDATKMGVGLPEYILLFRKVPSSSNNAYADDPVVKKIDDYLLSLWQLDAHAYWKSSGDRFLSFDELTKKDMKAVFNLWKDFDKKNIYDFQEHLRVCNDLDSSGRLSKLFMTIPPISSNDLVWTDINRMNTLNANQVNRKKEKHICPLQLDIIERLIYRFTNEGDLIDDPFGGLFSTAYQSLKMNRAAISCELNPDYYDDGLFYLKSIEYQLSVPTLFDLISEAV
jgi:DNA modification methylase